MSKQTPCGSRGTRGHPPMVGKGYGYGRGIAWEENGMAMGVGTEESRHRGRLGRVLGERGREGHDDVELTLTQFRFQYKFLNCIGNFIQIIDRKLMKIV